MTSAKHIATYRRILYCSNGIAINITLLATAINVTTYGAACDVESYGITCTDRICLAFT